MSNSPELSVVMSVYNGQDYLEESIESILNQSYSNFEFIIINDGSTDASGKIIENYAAKDKRIIYIQQQNVGLTKSLNIGVKRAKGKYIARQDADDVSFSRRFEKQMAFYSQHTDAVLCGTWCIETDKDCGSKVRKYPIDDSQLRKNLKYVNYFCHPSVIFLRDAFIEAGEYDESFTTAQDFELWIRLAEIGKLTNLPETLVNKRIGFSQAISWKHRGQKIDVIKKVISKHFSSWREINIFKSYRYYLPLLVYGLIPMPILKIIRIIRYRGKNGFENK